MGNTPQERYHKSEKGRSVLRRSQALYDSKHPRISWRPPQEILQRIYEEQYHDEPISATLNRIFKKLMNINGDLMEIELSGRTESLLSLLKERLNTSETEVIEEAITRLFREYQEEDGLQEVVDSKQPIPLIEVMDKSGLLDD